MKKKGLLVFLLVLVCVLVVGCGKKEENDPNVSTLKCTQEDGSEKLTMTIKQDKQSFKLVNGTLSMTTDMSGYGDEMDENTLKELICSEETYKNCSVKKDGSLVTVDVEYDMDKYTKELLEDEDSDMSELNADTLKTLKAEAESDGGTCTLS